MLRFLLLITFFASSSYGQILVGNGGDTLECRDGNPQLPAGLYVYDYLATFNRDVGQSEDTDHPDPPRRIYNLFRDRIPVLQATLRDFLDDAYHQLFNDPHINRRHVWRAAEMNNFIVDDENVVNGVPENCRQEDNPRRFAFDQTVYREATPVNKIYRYDIDIMRELKNDPLQYSYMLIHEWLWDYCESASVIREVNRFLHSKGIEDLSLDEIQTELIRRGMRLQPIPPTTQNIDVKFVDSEDGGIAMELTGTDSPEIWLRYHHRAFMRYDNQSSRYLMMEPSNGHVFSMYPNSNYSGWQITPIPSHLIIKYQNSDGEFVDSGHRLLFRRATN